MKKPEWKCYPVSLSTETGCKVGWKVYGELFEAEDCAEAAKFNAKIQESLGYDFGYCSPGSIEKLENGCFKVCIP
jgi:hypothetical protein